MDADLHHRRLDKHVTKLNDVLQNEPESDEGLHIVGKVAAHIADVAPTVVTLCVVGH